MATATRATLLTPFSTGAIAVIRLQGPDAERIVRDIFRPRADTGVWSASLADDCGSTPLRYGKLIADDEVIDDAVVCSVPGANPPAIDLNVHGGPGIVERLLTLLSEQGAEVDDGHEVDAWPAANRIEAEADRLMIQARTQRGVAFLARQRRLLPRFIADINERAATDPQDARRQLLDLLSGYDAARVLLHGAVLALMGPPNSGKSTLFNALLGRDAAVVSAQPGTTRDWVSGEIELAGLPVTLVDTAGRRVEADALEREAIRLGMERVTGASVRLLVLDAHAPLSPDDEALLAESRSDPCCLVAWNKTDLGTPMNPADGDIRLSALSGTGLDDLVAAVARLLIDPKWDDRKPCAFTARQHEVLCNLRDEPPAELFHVKQACRRLLEA